MSQGSGRRSGGLALGCGIAAALVAMGMLACGGSGSFQLAIDSSALSTPQQVGSFQVEFAEPGQGTCGALFAAATCANQFYPRNKMVLIREGKNGPESPGVLIPATIQLDGGTQDATEISVPVGVNYTLIVEALSLDNPPRLVATSCKPNQTVEVGNNLLFADPFNIYGTEDAGSIDCDPRWP